MLEDIKKLCLRMVERKIKRPHCVFSNFSSDLKLERSEANKMVWNIYVYYTIVCISFME